MFKFPANAPLLNPNGTWSFVGRVSAGLGFTLEDGSFPSEKVCNELCSSSNPAMVMKIHGVKTRVFPTKEAALSFATEHGFPVTDNA